MDRDGRSLATWKSELRKLLDAPADYRRVRIEPTDLSALAADPSALPERRIAAVVALAGRDDPEAKDRVRIAIDTCADEALREALEDASTDSLDEAVLRRAVRY